MEFSYLLQVHGESLQNEKFTKWKKHVTTVIPWSCSTILFSWDILLIIPTNMWLEYLVSALYDGFCGTTSVFATNNQKQNESFPWMENAAENTKNTAASF